MEKNVKKVRIYVMDISNKPFVSSKLNLLEKKRVENIVSGKNYLYRLRSLYAGLLLRHALINEGMSIDGPLSVKYNDYGKPFVEDGKKYNITHSGNVVMVAVADFEVGLDAEIRQNKVYSHIAHKVLTEREYMEYQSLSGAENTDYFIEHWVAKESYLKLMGTGIYKYPGDVDYDGRLVNGCICQQKLIKYKNHSYFVAVTTNNPVEIEVVYVSTLKVA
jgi:4'-phosphopantetheinyl transferase